MPSTATRSRASRTPGLRSVDLAEEAEQPACRATSARIGTRATDRSAAVRQPDHPRSRSPLASETSPSMNRTKSPPARRAPSWQAWTLPSQPGGRDRPYDRSRGAPGSAGGLPRSAPGSRSCRRSSDHRRRPPRDRDTAVPAGAARSLRPRGLVARGDDHRQARNARGGGSVSGPEVCEGRTGGARRGWRPHDDQSRESRCGGGGSRAGTSRSGGDRITGTGDVDDLVESNASSAAVSLPSAW